MDECEFYYVRSKPLYGEDKLMLNLMNTVFLILFRTSKTWSILSDVKVIPEKCELYNFVI